MKELWKLMEKDYQKENFTKKECLVYGVLMPIGLIAIMGFAGWLETLFIK